MNTIKAEQFQKIGFARKVDALKFIKEQNIRKERNESIPHLLKRIKQARIASKKERIQERKRYPVYGPKNKVNRNKKTTATLNTSQVANISYHKSSKQIHDQQIQQIGKFRDMIHSKLTKKVNLLKSENMIKYVYTLDPPFDLKIETIPHVAYDLENKYLQTRHDLEHTYPNRKIDIWGRIIYKVVLKHENDNGEKEIPNKTLVTFDDALLIKEIIASLIEKEFNKEIWYDKDIVITNYLFFARIYSDSGGCFDGPLKSKYKSEHKQIGNVKFSIKSYNYRNNNCLFGVLNHAFSSPNMVPDVIRKDMGYSLNTPIDRSEIISIIKYYNEKLNKNMGYILCDAKYKIIGYSNLEKEFDGVDINDIKPNDNIVYIYLNEDHYFHIVDIKCVIKCSICFQEFNCGNTHKCNPKVTSYARYKLHLQFKNKIGSKYNSDDKTYTINTSKLTKEQLCEFKKILEENKFVKPSNGNVKRIKRVDQNGKPIMENGKQLIDVEKSIILHFDIETISKMSLLPYAIGYKLTGNEIKIIFYGPDEVIDNNVQYTKDPFVKFVDILLEIAKEQKANGFDNVILNTFNGAGFDYYFLLKEILRRGITIKNMIQSGGRLLQLEFENIRCFDLYQFVQSSLKKACKDFKISDKNKKGDIDHKKYKSFDDVYEDRKNIIEYLRRDVEGMEELFMKVYELLYNNTKSITTNIGFSITNFLTLSHFAYEYWSTSTKEMIEIPCHKKCVDFIYPATFGGRTTAFQRFYESKYYMDLKPLFDEQINIKDLIKKINKEFKIDSDENYIDRMLDLENKATVEIVDEYKKLHDSLKINCAKVKNAYNIILPYWYHKVRYDNNYIKIKRHNNDIEKMIKKSKDEIEINELRNKIINEPIKYEQINKEALIDNNEILQKIYDSFSEEDDDIIFNLDICSLYPTAMGKYLYPTGPSHEIDNKEDAKLLFESGKLGFYEIEYTCPKNIMVPVLPKAKMIASRKVGCTWDLNNSVGMYTSISIEDAIRVGYKVEFTGKALYWDNKANIFDNYISKFFKIKNQSEKDGNKALKAIAKLMMNSEYGKNLQKPIFENTRIISSVFEFDEFIREHHFKDMVETGDDSLVITGIKRDVEQCMTKPSQLGAFITSYSRKIMLDMMLEMDPTLSSVTFTYTDTDSLHTKGKYAKILFQKGLAVSKDICELGQLCSDIDNEGIILREINLGPKNYLYECIDETGNYEIVMKTKGIDKKLLEKSFYEKAEPHKLTMENRLKKYNYKIPSTKNVGMYSIVSQDLKRTFNKTQWQGFKLIDNIYYPYGHEIMN